MNQKKTTALLLGLTMSLTGTAFAAPTDQAQDIDSRIAALEQQQSNLEKEIKELRHQNSQLKNQTRSQKKRPEQERQERARPRPYFRLRPRQLG